MTNSGLNVKVIFASPGLHAGAFTDMQGFCSGFPGFHLSREWQSWLWIFENDIRRGTARRAPTNDMR